MNRQEFRNLLQEGPLLLDGAMGTLLHEHGISLEYAFEAVNLRDPSLVAEIHQGYIDAGANIIETNSFGANPIKLREHDLHDKVDEINAAAVSVARQVINRASRHVLLAGSVGPLGARLAPLGRIKVEEATAAFSRQVEALVHARPQGVDLLVIETLSDLKEMEAAVKAARSVSADIPIVATMAFTRDDRTISGSTPDAVARRLGQLDVDVIGINCSVGPAQVLRLISIFRQVAPGVPLAAVPNAGWPEQSDGGRVIYPAAPVYFGRYARAFTEAGVSLVGGCCGTTAAHVAAMRQALDEPSASAIPLPQVEIVADREEITAVTDQPTRLAMQLANGPFIATVELSPPKGVAVQRLIAGGRMLKEAGANFLNVADSPLARMRMSAWAAAFLIQRELGLETILHFPTRGRNLLRIQGDLLAAYAMGIRNLFVVMGDPTRIGDYPEATDSYDIIPTGLIQLIKEQFNRGLDKAGQTIDQATNFAVGCALNLTPQDPDRELALLRKKMRHGADFAITQPVFDAERAMAFLDSYRARYDEPLLPILAGIKPLFNDRNAEFLHHEVPGIHIPLAYRRRMQQAKIPQAEGVRIAQEILEEIRPSVQGVYLTPAFGRYDLVANVLDALRD